MRHTIQINQFIHTKYVSVYRRDVHSTTDTPIYLEIQGCVTDNAVVQSTANAPAAGVHRANAAADSGRGYEYQRIEIIVLAISVIAIEMR